MLINLLNLFFPKVCYGCSNLLTDNELQVCTQCRHDLPLTNFHEDGENAVHKALYGRVQLVNATALLHFSKKGIVQQLMHNLKYRGYEEIGHFLGVWLGEELKYLETYKAVEVVVPVPLHKSKLRKRGYNQVDKFGRALALALDAEYQDSSLIKITNTKTQVFKDRLKRGSAINANFAVQNYANLEHKHILLVDDIITTGSTIEACANELLKIKGISLSLAVMAITD